MMKDQAKFSACEQETLICLSCFQTNHTIKNCQSLHYIPDRHFYIRRYAYNIFQQRNESPLKKRRKLKFNCKKKLLSVQEAAERLTSYEEFSDISQSEDENQTSIKLDNSKKMESKRASILKLNPTSENKIKPQSFLIDEQSSPVFFYIFYFYKIYKQSGTKRKNLLKISIREDLLYIQIQ